jgi:2-hydroxy-6-oxonona-2,4-dienedioate hydrolase
MDYAICGVRRFVRTFRAMLQDRIEDKLPWVAVPALVVPGSRDRIVSQAWAEAATRLLPNARLVVIPGAAHAINFSYPAELKAIALRFLLKTSAAPAPITGLVRPAVSPPHPSSPPT